MTKKSATVLLTNLPEDVAAQNAKEVKETLRRQ